MSEMEGSPQKAVRELAGTTEGPVKGGGDTEVVGDCGCGRHEKRPGSHHAHDCPRFYCRTKPEPDIPERLRDTYRTLVQANFPHSANAVADALAEIERLERLTTQQSDLARNLMSDREEAIAQLRAITEEESKHEAGHE